MPSKEKKVKGVVAAALERALAALASDSNDEEHDALSGLLDALSPDCPEPLSIPERYRVRWEIDSDADTPEGAAYEALAAMQTATMLPVFEIIDHEGNRVEIDMDKLGQETA